MSALDTLIEMIRDLRDRVRGLEQQETPFEAGVLPPSAGGTGVDNGTAVLTLAASISLSGASASSGKILRHDGTRFVPATLAAGDLPGHASTHESGGSDALSLAASQITAGTLAPARLGSGSPSASTLLFGDSTWATLAAADIPNLDASKITTGALPLTRGGTGATSAAGALSAIGAAAASHSHAAGDVTSGTLAPARLGSGSPSAATLLFGDSTWATLAAADIPNLDASKITSGTIATARLGSGTASASTALFGDQTYKTVPTGSGADNCLVIWNGTTGLTFDTNTYTDGTTIVSTNFKFDTGGGYYDSSANKLLGARRTGWSAWTGTATRSSKATSTATLANVAEALKALVDDLIAHGVIGA